MKSQEIVKLPKWVNLSGPQYKLVDSSYYQRHRFELPVSLGTMFILLPTRPREIGVWELMIIGPDKNRVGECLVLDKDFLKELSKNETVCLEH